MAEKILNGILNDEITTEDLFNWISHKNHQFNHNEFSQFPCTKGDFISHFLNYIHEDAPSFDVENSNKITFTPKSIRSTERRDCVEQSLIKKRPALFSEVKNDLRTPHSHMIPLMPAGSIKYDKYNANGDFKSNATTTPKLVKIYSEGSLDNSYCSPVSPLYSRNSLNTPKNRGSNNKSTEKGLCLGDFIVQKKSSSKKKMQRNLSDLTIGNIENKKGRRINPTNLNEKKFNNSFKESDNSFNFKNKFVELSVDNLNEQRNLLAEERLKIKQNIDDLVKIPNIMKLQMITNKTEITAVPEKITYKRHLDRLIETYVYFLNNNCTLNLSSEIHFLISLLLTKQYINDDRLNDSDNDIQMLEEESVVNQKSLFKTVHNCVYFAVSALNTQTCVLQTLDRTTLKLLYENDRIKLFSESLQHNLTSMYNNKLEQTKETIENLQNNVCFMSDTDNRENFPTDASFHAFRKQRDLFYEILRIWEQNHFIPEWSFPIALGGKIKSLLGLHHDPENYRHFARLFKMQLLTSCRRFVNDETISKQQASILASLPNVDADKLYRLKNRLVTKQDDNSPNAIPTFTGDQEFYKDFILYSGSNIFYQHLKDTLILEIIQLTNNTCDDLSETEENDCTADAASRNSYFSSLKFLRILAKFLGFLESLPYQIDAKTICDKIFKIELETRKWYRSTFDLKTIILNSLKHKTLTLTIPWVSKYLSMLDFVTLRLPYFEEVLQILFCIHHSTYSGSRENSPNVIYNKMLIKLSLGWLFELPHFPSELYFTWLSKSTDISVLNLNLDDLTINQSEFQSAKANSTRKGIRLDELGIVDQNILYTFCPYLEGFRKLLSTNSCNHGNAVKHITPLSTVEYSIDAMERKLKSQLEEAFFNGQPVSVRKTVEFISERVASSSVKHICNNVVPEFKKASLNRAKIAFEEVAAGHDVDSKQLEPALKNKINELSTQYLKHLQEICSEETEKLTNARIPTSLDALLAVDELEQTKETCVVISKRLCIDRVQQWVNSHVNIGLFNKAFNSECQKLLVPPNKDSNKEKPVFMLPSGGRDLKHDDNTLNAVKIVEIIRNLSTDLLESKTIQSSCIKDLLESIEASILSRCDVNDQISSMINRMLVDLVLLLLTHKMEYFDENLPLFLRHWKRFVKTNENIFKTLICPRNVMLIRQSKNVKRSWMYLAKFAGNLLEVGLLSCDTFETQCIAIYQHNWDEPTIKHLSACFREVMDTVNQSRPNTNEFTLLMNFLTTYCSNMDF